MIKIADNLQQHSSGRPDSVSTRGMCEVTLTTCAMTQEWTIALIAVNQCWILDSPKLCGHRQNCNAV